ncbi:hypothetical protein FOG18_08760 [Legionella israelensis]|uniref:hypothetical protein n=1 Tax=Legionella israelensis TaxID=454 RepID=UPI00117F7075|nr:hypothetical protein [Legionella israelensis]QDP72638.1 hypothetical protein FOG18_08760 [Legionella israelensis]
MKLLVIVLCLFSERFLIHTASFNRFSWFKEYYSFIARNLQPLGALSAPVWLLIGLILPIVIISALVLFFLEDVFYGFFGLILNIIILYYCLGPQNPFYPITEKKVNAQGADQNTVSGRYLVEVNGQLFAVLFWYILTGPLGIIIYRTISLSQDYEPVAAKAKLIIAWLDWLPARMTALFYMLVGNFQRGAHYFAKYFTGGPAKNNAMLSECGIAAASIEGDKTASISAAENLVEHSVIVFLVFLALFTLAAWL